MSAWSDMTNKEVQREEAIEHVQEDDIPDKEFESWEEVETSSDEVELRLVEREELIAMRSRWSRIVMWLLGAIVVSDILFMWAVGFGLLAFSKEWEVPVFVGESIVKTIGLAYIIVNFLFHKDSIKG